MDQIRKLVRDGYISSQSVHPGAHFETADHADLDQLLFEKANEELLELNDAIKNGDTDDIAQEAADAIEAIFARAKLAGVNPEQVETARKSKKEKLGGFEKGIILVRK
jgi:predicted house-cleaning noncanonical NTP pyrophosphatase (MazG superfamily)